MHTWVQLMRFLEGLVPEIAALVLIFPAIKGLLHDVKTYEYDSATLDDLLQLRSAYVVFIRTLTLYGVQ